MIKASKLHVDQNLVKVHFVVLLLICFLIPYTALAQKKRVPKTSADPAKMTMTYSYSFAVNTDCANISSRLSPANFPRENAECVFNKNVGTCDSIIKNYCSFLIQECGKAAKNKKYIPQTIDRAACVNHSMLNRSIAARVPREQTSITVLDDDSDSSNTGELGGGASVPNAVGTTGGSSLASLCDQWRTTPNSCEPVTNIQLLDEVSQKAKETEFKKLLYEKSMNRLIAGVESFQNGIAMSSQSLDRPSEKLKDLICCDSMATCTEGTSYAATSMAEVTGYKNENWQPSFCKNRVNSCHNINSKSTSVQNMNVVEVQNKLNRFSSELKGLGQSLSENYAKLSSLTIENSGCNELTPMQAKIGNPNCKTKNLTFAELAKKIISRGVQNQSEKAYVESFNSYVAKHKILSGQPYVLLLTKGYGDAYSGKHFTYPANLNGSMARMSDQQSEQQVKDAIENFSQKLATQSVCSMKRLYAGIPAGQFGDLNGIDDCFKTNRELMSMVHQNETSASELLSGKGLEGSAVDTKTVGKLICIPQENAKECQDFWKKYDPYISWGKLGAGLAGSMFVPWVTIPYFYAEAAIDIANSLDNLQDAKTSQEQIFAQYLKNEMNQEDVVAKFDESEERISAANLGVLMSVVGGATEVATGSAFKNLGKKLLIRVRGTNEAKRQFTKLVASGNKYEIEKFLKNNPDFSVDIVEDVADQTLKTTSTSIVKGGTYTPIVEPNQVKTSDLFNLDKRAKKDLENIGVKYSKVNLTTAVDGNVNLFDKSSLVDDLGYPGSDNYFGSIYLIEDLPKTKGKKNYLTPALLHPEMESYKEMLESMGYKLVVDTSMNLSGAGAYFWSKTKVVALTPNSRWQDFAHEFQHAEFDKYLRPQFSNLVNDMKTNGTLKGGVIETILTEGNITPQKAKNLEKLLKKELPELGVNESLSVGEELRLMGFRRYVPNTGTCVEKYALKHQITELEKLNALTETQKKTLAQAKKRFQLLENIDVYGPGVIQATKVGTAVAAGGTVLGGTLVGAYYLKNKAEIDREINNSSNDPTTFKQIVYSQDGKSVLAQKQDGTWVTLKK